MTRSDLDAEDDGDRPEIVHWYPPRRHPHARAVDIESVALAALATIVMTAAALAAMRLLWPAAEAVGRRPAKGKTLLDRCLAGFDAVARPRKHS